MSNFSHSGSPALSSFRKRLFGEQNCSSTDPIDKQTSKTTSTSVIESIVDVLPANEQLEHNNIRKKCRNEIWKHRWDAAPDNWKQFVATLDKEFGLTKAEEIKISRRNKTYVETPELTSRGRLGTSAIILTVGTISKVFFRSLNTVHSHNMGFLYSAIEKRPDRCGLLTFSNHQSVMDDPFLLGALLPPRILANAALMRWGLCSLDICFQNAWISRTLRLGKALPIQRRGGMSQSFLRPAADKLIAGDWLHIYPEGRVRQRGMGYSKRGIGKILTMAFEAHGGMPLILPMYHEGIECVMPQNIETNSLESSVPKSGQSMFVVMGEPVDVAHIFDRMMPECQASGGTEVDAPPCLRMYEEIADFMGVVMRLLRADARKLVKGEHGVDLGDPYEFS